MIKDERHLLETRKVSNTNALKYFFPP